VPNKIIGVGYMISEAINASQKWTKMRSYYYVRVRYRSWSVHDQPFIVLSQWSVGPCNGKFSHLLCSLAPLTSNCLQPLVASSYSASQKECHQTFYAQQAIAATAVARLSHLNSVSLSVTQVDQSKTVQATITKSSPSAASKTLVSGTVKLFHKFEGGHPERGR